MHLIPFQQSIRDLCAKAEQLLAPTVVRIRHSLDWDMSEEEDLSVIQFLIVLSDEAAKLEQLGASARKAEATIRELLNSAGELNIDGFKWTIPVRCYWNYRSLAETLQHPEKAWE